MHWFDKVEMFTYTTIEESFDEHQRLLAWEKEWLDKLELAYRVIDTAAGDLGLSAQRKFDCEAWIPTQGKYRELTSTSNCTDFQARRLDIRGRFAEGVRHLATLNGTLVAIPSTIVAILETHQQADGSVRVPAALQPYLQGREVLEPVSRVEPSPRGWSRSTSTGRCSPTCRRPARSRRRSGPSWSRPSVGRTTPGRTSCSRPAARRSASPTSGTCSACRPRARRDQVLAVASNGSVTFRYPPVEVRSTDDLRRERDRRGCSSRRSRTPPSPSRRSGVGYRINRPFPEGEITGEMQLQSIDELVAEPVTRVIIRDPHSSEEEFLALAEKLGLHGTNYFIGWTAWLDIAPEGISKASALADVAEELGVAQADVLAIGDGRNDIEMLGVGRPRGRDGAGAARGAGGRRRRHRDRRQRRRRDRAVALVLRARRPRLTTCARTMWSSSS